MKKKFVSPQLTLSSESLMKFASLDPLLMFSKVTKALLTPPPTRSSCSMIIHIPEWEEITENIGMRRRRLEEI